MTDLERECEEIRRERELACEYGKDTPLTQHPRQLDTLLAYIDELRRPSDAKEIAEIQERQEKRRHGQWVQFALYSVAANDIDLLLHALAESQRDNARYANAHIINMAGADAAEKRVRELEADARRYRFLREPDNAILYARHKQAWGDYVHPYAGHVRYDTPEQLDAAIDSQLPAALASPLPAERSHES